MNRLLTASLLLALAFSANAAESETPEKSDRVCFKEARTGTNIKRKVCMSKEEAEKRRQEDKAAMEGFKRGSSGRGSAGADPGLGR